ncbi:MAG: sulfatase-like hydrolase/transferase, partial [Spirosomaceae bacterium]|nr:sulfatase-like hydrolase/transferase [Spirosomataceae bacterium]
MIKSIVLFLFLVATISSCNKTAVSTEEVVVSTDKPNIVFIIADDMGWDVFGNYPGITGQKAKTPTLDSLAKNGLTFTNFWTNPECSPTRAAILSGKYGFRTGIGGVEAPPTKGLAASETVIHKYISDKTSNAYATALIGKWHVSLNNDLNAPEDFGIQYYSGFLTGAVNDYYSWTQTSGGVQQTVTTYATTHFVNQSIDWVKSQQKPFFLWLAFNAPHTPFHRPPLNLISDKTLSANQSTIDANP